jgi:hypothetical protein
VSVVRSSSARLWVFLLFLDGIRDYGGRLRVLFRRRAKGRWSIEHLKKTRVPRGRELKQSEEVVKRRSWQTSWELGIRSVRALAEQEAQLQTANWELLLVPQGPLPREAPLERLFSGTWHSWAFLSSITVEAIGLLAPTTPRIEIVHHIL